MLTHYWKASPKTNINTTASYQTGEIGNSRLDYTKANNPDPVYYKKLPSYFTNSFTDYSADGIYNGDSPLNVGFANDLKSAFLANGQINWNDDIYRVNQENIANGSRIVLYEDRNDEKIATANTNISSKLSDNIFLNAGVNYSYSTTRNFKNMLDLLGGTYFTDISTFGFGDQQQSDLNNPFRTVKVGDKYGYNYNIYATKLEAFTQFKFTYKKIDFYINGANHYQKGRRKRYTGYLWSCIRIGGI